MHFNQDDVYDLLCKIDLSKSCRLDEIPGRLLKEGAPCLHESLFQLFTLSLKTAKLPQDWTSAIVTTVFKNRNMTLRTIDQ